jgi:hypothetical protein
VTSVHALDRSSDGIVELIELGVANGGKVPRARWQNFPTDLEHFLSYFAAHEAHHRGQLTCSHVNWDIAFRGKSLAACGSGLGSRANDRS